MRLRPDAEPRARYRVWHEKYGSDTSVVGAVYQINGHPFTVIGVAAPGFFGAKLAGWGMPDFWLPLTTEPLIDGATARLKRPNGNFLDLIGRVGSGVSPKSLEAKLRVELYDWLASHVPDMEPGEKQLWQQKTLHLIPGGSGVEAMRDQYQDGLKLLLVASGCVLLVACGNLANLMLARGLKDRAETSVRVALGASRGRVVRKSLVECIMLAVMGGALGIAVAYAGTRLILHLAFQIGGPNNYVPISATPSFPVLLFTLIISVLTGVIFGTVPAWVASHADPVEALRGATRSVGGSRSWTQKSLVIAQATMSLVLLSAAALLGKSLRNLQHQNFGFETRDRYIAWINPILGNYKPEQLEPLFRQIVDRLRQIAQRIATLARSHNLPEHAVIRVAATIVADRGPDGFRHGYAVVREQFFDRFILEFRRGFERLVQICDISLMMLAMVNLHGHLVDVRLQRIGSIGQRRKCESHVNLLCGNCRFQFFSSMLRYFIRARKTSN